MSIRWTYSNEFFATERRGEFLTIIHPRLGFNEEA
jgi:hypothetical protein